MTKECKQQFTLRITQANSTELVVILYEMLLQYLQEGEEAHKARDEAAFREAVRRIRGCLSELMHSLNMKYEPAPSLRQLYLYCMRSLVICEIRRDAEGLGQIRGVIEPLRDAYAKIAGLNENGPVMNNSQTVYAGLTYGRNTLTENMADQGTNRGMLV